MNLKCLLYFYFKYSKVYDVVSGIFLHEDDIFPFIIVAIIYFFV